MTDQTPQPPRRAALFRQFDELGIAHETYDHEPIFTVEEGRHLKAQWPGAHSKNLFLKDKKGALALVSARDETEIKLNNLAKAIGMARPSFGKPELMEEVLGVTPGSVTIFALGHENAGRLDHVVLDAALLAAPKVHFHPLENSATTAVSPDDLLKFVRAYAPHVKVMDFADPEAPRDITADI